MRSLLSNFYKKCAFLIKDNVTCSLTIIWQKPHLLWVRNYTDSVSKFIELNTSRNLELKSSIWREPSKRDSVMRLTMIDYVDTRISNFVIKYFPENEKVRKTVLAC